MISFKKMHGNGNDFIVIENLTKEHSLSTVKKPLRATQELTVQNLEDSTLEGMSLSKREQISSHQTQSQ